MWCQDIRVVELTQQVLEFIVAACRNQSLQLSLRIYADARFTRHTELGLLSHSHSVSSRMLYSKKGLYCKSVLQVCLFTKSAVNHTWGKTSNPLQVQPTRLKNKGVCYDASGPTCICCHCRTDKFFQHGRSTRNRDSARCKPKHEERPLLLGDRFTECRRTQTRSGFEENRHLRIAANGTFLRHHASCLVSVLSRCGFHLAQSHGQ